MKHILIIILLTSSNFVVLSQELESIEIRVEHANEPPTKSGQQVFQISFRGDELNNLKANSYTKKYKRKKKVKLEKTETINADELKKFVDFYSASKSNFLLSEFGIDIIELNKSNSAFKPNFQIKEKTIKTDSFQICKDWQFKRSLSTGGFSININLRFKNNPSETINFDSDDLGAYKFDLQSYLLIQPLLENKIPAEFRIQEFFNKEHLIMTLNYYFKVIECEGYYYDEFIKQNPQRTKRENRMMVGWDFEKYLSKRNKK